MPQHVVDFRGYFHMDELVRKTARELSRLGFATSAFTPSVLRTSIGTKIGTWSARLNGTKDGYIPQAGVVRGFLSKRPFGSWVTATISISFAGEGYEDFRRKVGIPFFTTATAVVDGRVNPRLDYRVRDPSQLRSLVQRPHTYSPAYHQGVQALEDDVVRSAANLARKMEGASFSRECPFCKSLFVGDLRCPYCGAPQTTQNASLLHDSSSLEPSGESPWGR